MNRAFKSKKRFVSMGIYPKSCGDNELKLLRAYGFECYEKKINNDFVEIFMR